MTKEKMSRFFKFAPSHLPIVPKETHAHTHTPMPSPFPLTCSLYL